MNHELITILCWDFDGTLYRLNDNIWQAMFEAQYRVIMNHTGWTREKAEIEHKKLYKIKFSSSQQTTAHLSSLTVLDTLKEAEEFYDRSKFVKYDQKLVDMFNKLKDFRHIMFVNGWREREEPVIDILGLPRGTFEHWITPEETHVVKPDPGHFQAILDYTKLPPENHLVIGDRPDVDLIPAKNLGFAACQVWTEERPENIDYSFSSVYDVIKIF